MMFVTELTRCILQHRGTIRGKSDKIGVLPWFFKTESGSCSSCKRPYYGGSAARLAPVAPMQANQQEQSTKKVHSNKDEWYIALMLFWANFWAKLADGPEKSGCNGFYRARVGWYLLLWTKLSTSNPLTNTSLATCSVHRHRWLAGWCARPRNYNKGISEKV